MSNLQFLGVACDSYQSAPAPNDLHSHRRASTATAVSCCCRRRRQRWVNRREMAPSFARRALFVRAKAEVKPRLSLDAWGDDLRRGDARVQRQGHVPRRHSR